MAIKKIRMFRRDSNFKPKTKYVNCILMNGGVGDHMASLVAINYIMKQYTYIKLLVWLPDYLVEFAKHVLPYGSNVYAYSEMEKKYDAKKTTITTKWDSITSPMKTSLLDYAFAKLCDENPSIINKNYLKIKPDEIDVSEIGLPDKYVVITAGYTAEVREFKAKYINKITNYIDRKGCGVVFLGQTKTATGGKFVIEGKFNEEIDFTNTFNLVDKTTLLQAAKIMGNAKAVIGVDNGLLHVAACTDVTIIGGFTTVTPETRLPVRHDTLGWNYLTVEPDKDLGCRFCQVKTNFLYGHNYTKCIYKDNLCTDQMTDIKFINHLEKIL